MVILFGFLACGVASGQESVVSVPSQSDQAARSDTRRATSFELKGVLISESSRMALVNGQTVQEGDRVAGVEIISIDQAGVRVLIGARELTVNIGGTVAGGQTGNDVASRSRLDASLRHAVKPGETLSGIALRYRRDGVTLDQTMSALFHANVQAFDDNINVLYEGAILRMPDTNELHRHAPEMATAEVVRHTDRWQSTHHKQIKVAKRLSDEQYGPVESGETLSDIAASVLHDGVTMNQMMIALFHANTHAFDDNINVLYAGARLRIPDANELSDSSPESAAAEVVRQTNSWQTENEQHAVVTLAHANIIASNEEPRN